MSFFTLSVEGLVKKTRLYVGCRALWHVVCTLSERYNRAKDLLKDARGREEEKMFKRLVLSLTFVATFGIVGTAFTETADARRWWRGGFVGSYYGAPAFYRYRAPYWTYRSYYGPRRYRSWYYAPYRPYRNYGYPGNFYYYGPRGRVALRVGF
jgi:hypothetical protein